MVYFKVPEPTHGKMDATIKDSTVEGLNMAKEYSLIQRDLKLKVFGNMDK
jgi:hypothetical protein